MIVGLIMTGLCVSCGHQTKGHKTEAEAETVADNHSEAYIRQRIDTIYNQVYHRQFNIDSAFCSQRYYTLLQQTLQLNEETGFVCLDYDHWIMGQDCSPEWTHDVKKIENITDSTATAEIDIRNFGKHNSVMLKLKFERGDWFVDDFVSYTGDATDSQSEYSEVKVMEKFINDLLSVREKGNVFTGYWGWVYEDTPELLLRLVMTDKGLECTECTIYRLHSYHNVKVSFDGDYLYLMSKDFNVKYLNVIRYGVKVGQIDKNDIRFDYHYSHFVDSFKNTFEMDEAMVTLLKTVYQKV